MKKIILDTNIVLDFFIEERAGHKKIKSFIEGNRDRVKFLITSYQFDTIYYLLRRYLKEENISEKLKNFLAKNKINIISTTGKDNLRALKYPDVEDGILMSICERVGDDCLILTNDKLFLKEFKRAISPNDFKINEDRTVPLLDLKLEYLTNIEDLEGALLKASISAKYILGPEVSELEQKIADYIGVKHAIGVSSGTDALVLSLRALAIKLRGKEYWDKNDLIITTPFTFTATGEAILRAGATPLFVDITLDTYNIDPQEIEKALQRYGNRVVGILPVHLYGHPCNMDEIMDIAQKAKIFVVEDCAQSLGARWDGRQTGSFGEAGCFSFFPSKPLGGFGDGGMVTTNDSGLAEIIRTLRTHGGRDKNRPEHIGYNARLDTLQAAILLAKLEHLDEFTEKRRQIAEFYNQNFKDIDWLIPPMEQEKAFHVYHQYTIRVRGRSRDEVQNKLGKNGVKTMVYYPVPLHRMEVFRRTRMEIFGDLENTETAVKNVLSLPIEPLYFEHKTILEKVVNAFF